MCLRYCSNMIERKSGAPETRPPKISDLRAALRSGFNDFMAEPLLGVVFAGFYVLAGLLISWITYLTGHTFWLVLAALGFPMVGAFAALGFYEISRRRAAAIPCDLSSITRTAWDEKNGQVPWFASIIIVIFLFWFFLGHMIFALFLGLTPMTNIFSSFDVLLSAKGLAMIAFGTCVGAVFSTLIYAMSVLGIPMLLDREVDFVSAMVKSIKSVLSAPIVYLAWGALIGAVTLVAMIPFFLGLFLVLPVFGHATWHLYRRVTVLVPEPLEDQSKTEKA